MEGLAQNLPRLLSTGGTILSAGSQIGAGISARRAGEYEAAQSGVAAGQAQAASHRTAAEVERRSKLLQSRALAVGAASGGGTGGTVMDLIAGIAGEGAYRSQLALFEGNDTARALNARGDAARFQGAQAQRAGFIGAVGSLLKGGKSLFEKYGLRAVAPSTENYGFIDD